MLRLFRGSLSVASRRSLVLLGAGAALGLALMGVELAFAFTLQAFLVQIGALNSRALAWPGAWPRPAGLRVYALLILVGSVRSVLVGLQVYLQGAAGEELKMSLRSRLVRQIFRARSASASESMTLFTARADAMGAAAGAAQTLSTQVLLAALLGAYLLRLAPALTLVAGGLLLAAAAPLRVINRRARQSGESINAEWQRVTERMLSSMKNLLLLQVHGTQEQEKERAFSHLTAFHEQILTYYEVLGFNQGVPQAVGLAAVVAAAAWAGRGGGASPGTLVAFFYLFLRLVQVGAQASQAVATLTHMAPQVREVLEWSRRPEETLPPTAHGRAPASQVAWRLQDAVVRYPGAPRDAVGPASFDLNAGECLVVTGPSGSGKSTLISLLLGLIEPRAGSAETVLDGKRSPVAPARGRLLSAVGYVGPESFLIEGTVLDNLRYGLTCEPSPAEVEDALAATECGFLKDLPAGLSHRLTEQGQGLSAGQKQRLALARALLRRPAVLILDEATSNLDAETESHVIETLSRLKGRMTIVAVSHRPALLALADRRLELAAPPPTT